MKLSVIELNYNKYSIKLQLRQDVENQIQLQLHHFCIINYNYVIGPSSAGMFTS